MSLYTVVSQQTLLTGSDPTAAAAQLLGVGNEGPQVNVGDLVTVSDPPTVVAGYTQVTTSSGTVGWLPSSAIQQGTTGSTSMNLAIIAAIGFGFWYFLLRRR